MLILHIPNALQHSSPDCIAQILRRRLGMDVPQIDSPIQTLGVHTTHSTQRVLCVRGERREGYASGLHGRLHRLCDK